MGHASGWTMRSLRARFALLVGSVAVLVVLAAAGLFWAVQATEQALERTLAAQSRLDLLAELSGRLADYGLIAVDAVSAPTSRPERLAAARAEVDRALNAVDAKLGASVAGADSLLGRTEFAARSRPLAKLRAALDLLDRQLEQALHQPDPALRNDATRGALNAFGAITGPSLSFLVEAERRGIEAASADARALSDRLRMGALVAAVGALAAVALMHRAVTRPLLKRIEAVRRAAGAVGRGELDTRLLVTSRDELGLLVTSFNRMAARLARRERRVATDRAALEETIARRTADLRAANERLRAVDETRRRFFADVSHELRTPLTVILGECDLALRGSPPAEGYRPVLATIRKRAQRLHRRVEDMLRIARSESGQIELDLKPVSLLPVLTEAVETFAQSAKRQGVALTLQPGQADVEALADREWLRQIVEGLIDNALRHACGATQIAVALSEGPDSACIAVSDDGPGFPQPEAQLLERFARAEVRPSAPGFGIGLALARWIVERHHGAIHLGPAEGGRGARAVIHLPAERKEDVA